MDRKDKIDDLLIRKYAKEIMDEVIPPRGECPHEELLWKYSNRESTEEEKKYIEKHLISCDECLETVKFMRMTHGEVPEKLYRNAQEILQREILQGGLKPCPPLPGTHITPLHPSQGGITPLRTITLIWDKVRNTITSELEGLTKLQEIALQPVRDGRESALESPLYRVQTETNIGSIIVEIDRSEREGYLTISISSPCPENIPVHMQVCLYKAEKNADDPEGEKTWVKRVELSFAEFKGIALQGGTDYRLEFFDYEKSQKPIDSISLPVMIEKSS